MEVLTDVIAAGKCGCTTSSHDHKNSVCNRSVFTREGDVCESCQKQEAAAARKYGDTVAPADAFPPPATEADLADQNR